MGPRALVIGDVQRFVTGRFWRRDPVAQTAGRRPVMIGDDRIDLPGEEFFVVRIGLYTMRSANLSYTSVKANALGFIFRRME